jgi:chromosome segregation ATPase
MKTRAIIVYAMIFVPLVCHPDHTWAKSTELMQESYKKIADGLIGIRKEFPPAQPKVYAMLDQLDKLHSTAKNVTLKKNTYKKKLLEKTAENAALRNELNTLRSEMSSTKSTLESAKSTLDQKLEEDKEQIELLTREKKELLNKIAELEIHKKEIVAEKKTKHTLNKNELVALTAQKIAEEHQPNLSRISTSDPNSPR